MKVVEFEHNFGPLTWTQARTYTHAKPLNHGSVIGNGWKTRQLPRLVKTKDAYSLQFSNRSHINYRYEEATGGFVGTAHHKDTLIIDKRKQEVRATRANGSVWFFDYSETEDSQLKRIDDADGRFVLFEYNNNRLARIQDFNNTSETSPVSCVTFSYGANDLLSEVILQIADRQKKLQNHLKIVYVHYDNNDTHGNLGDLMTACRYVGDGEQWQESGTWYYRYYKDGDSHGHRHGMKSAFLPQEFASLRLAKRENVTSASDAEISAFASFEFEYDASERKTLERSARGTLLKTWRYESFAGARRMNQVHSLTTETRSDGGKTILVKNKFGKVLLKEEYADTDELAPMRILNVYDRGGNIVRKYLHGSIQSWALSEQSKSKTIDIVVSQDEGQIVCNVFDSSAQRAKKIRQTVQRGETGAAIPQRCWEYESFEVSGKKHSKVRKHTVFSDEVGKNVIETEYRHEWLPHSEQFWQKMTLLPAVSETENGDGRQAQLLEIHDLNSRTVWTKNEVGVISHSVYDDRNGKLIRRIDDVDTTQTSDFGTPLPGDWKMSDEAGKHDVTDYQYDFKGRLIQIIGPDSEGIDDTGKLVRTRSITWHVYDDLNRMERSASGYLELDDVGNTAKTVLLNPVSIIIKDVNGNVTDHIQASRNNLAGPLTAEDQFEQDSYISWTKNIYHFGKLVAMRQYHLIPESGEGILGDCYAETRYDYDIRGRRVRTVSPSGAIHRTVYDSRGNAVQSWVGTADAGATDTNPKSDNPTNNMRLVSETVYGRGSNCSSCSGGAGDRVLAQVQYLSGGKSRVTEYKYDWRGRQIETLGDEDEQGNSIVSVQHYDNLDRVVMTEQYLCRESKKAKNFEKRLVSRTEMCHNSRGQVWKTVQSIIDAKKGDVRRKVDAESWFDAAGRVVKQKHGNRRGYHISEYKPNGVLKRTAQISESGEIVAESMPVLDRRGRNVGGVQKSRRMKAVKREGHVLPKDFGIGQTSALRYTRQWRDPVGRVIATGDYGFVEGDAISVSEYIPRSGEIVRVAKTVYNTKTGRVLAQIDSEGRETRSEVDAAGRTVKTIMNFKGDGVFSPEKPDENITTEMRYDISGNLIWRRDPAGNVTQQVYDKLGRLATTIAPNGGRTCYEYDVVGQAIAVTDPMGRTTRYEYDSHGRRTKTILPKPNEKLEPPIQETVYNELGQVAAQIDPLGHKTCYEYDELGRKTRQIDAEGGVTAFAYDDEGKLLSLTDPVSNTTRYEYDELGRRTAPDSENGTSQEEATNSINTAQVDVSVLYGSYEPYYRIQWQQFLSPHHSSQRGGMYLYYEAFSMDAFEVTLRRLLPVTNFSYYPNGFTTSSADAQYSFSTNTISFHNTTPDYAYFHELIHRWDDDIYGANPGYEKTESHAYTATELYRPGNWMGFRNWENTITRELSTGPSDPIAMKRQWKTSWTTLHFSFTSTPIQWGHFGSRTMTMADYLEISTRSSVTVSCSKYLRLLKTIIKGKWEPFLKCLECPTVADGLHPYFV